MVKYKNEFVNVTLSQAKSFGYPYIFHSMVKNIYGMIIIVKTL